MKNIAKILGVTFIIATMALPLTANAQIYKPSYFNIDWQFNGLVTNDYADAPSGWGMNFEGGYYATSKIAVGLYASFHTNDKYIGEQLLHLNSNSDLYTDQIHSTFQVPFGALLKYRFIEDRMFEPYATIKLGAMFSRMTSETQVLEFYDEGWGFNAQPEIGVSIYPSAHNRFGIHLAMYYSYSTNRNQVLCYEINGYNNIGFHVGVTF